MYGYKNRYLEGSLQLISVVKHLPHVVPCVDLQPSQIGTVSWAYYIRGVEGGHVLSGKLMFWFI